VDGLGDPMDAYTETFDVDVSKKFIRFDEKNRVVY
jgi:hypothetical protein